MSVDDTEASSTSLELGVPELCLVLLVGASGSGKSTFAQRCFRPFEVVSSDFCRGLVSNEVTDQAATPAAFEVLHMIVGKRLDAGLLTVVDATNLKPDDRAELIKVARDHDVLTAAIVLDTPKRVCLERDACRGDRTVGEGVINRQCAQVRQSLGHLNREHIHVVHVLKGDDADRATIVRTRLFNDRRDDHGPFDIVGDVHGCLDELLALLGQLGYQVRRDDDGRAVDAVHPEGRRALFLGDLIDRGPDVVGVLRLAMGMTAADHALAVPGNHEAKLVRALGRGGARVHTSHGLAQTLAQLAEAGPEFTARVREWCDGLIGHYVLDDGRLVVAHAGLKQAYQGRTSGRVRAFALYGDTTGESDEYGLPVRYPWARDYRGPALVVYGHTPTLALEWVNNTICIDTGCVFGGSLTALRYPERELVSVPAARVYSEPVRPLVASPALERTLDITDVLGRHAIQTGQLGAVVIRPEQAAGALEVMSRFAVAPQLLAYLPPTMSPVASAHAEGFLEHPDEAFGYFRDEGVAEVVCERKHMGSRGVVWVFRDESAAERVLGTGHRGVITTRTGRGFFDRQIQDAALARVAAALERAGLWREWDADWALLDAEILPWSLKADDLIRRQYLGLSSSAHAMLGAAAAALDQAAARGQDVASLAAAVAQRQGETEAYAQVITGFAWPTQGLAGVRIAPFQVLATSGQTRYSAEHAWHMGVAERLAQADADAPDEAEPLLIPTPWLAVNTADAASRQAGIAWWRELTAAGGEGMVVKPASMPVRGTHGLVQPGLKVRGQEYLRVTYGPDYLRPDKLERLRVRNLGRKRSLALREYALGLEAIDRLVAGDPVWRVHEAVFGVLALESDPVDPRL